jgi:glucose/arabinose dehydrogenase
VRRTLPMPDGRVADHPGLSPSSIVVATLLIVAGIARPSFAAVVVPTGFVDEVMIAGISQPNSFAFLPDGRVLFTEQMTGRVRVLVVAKSKIAATDPALQVPGVNGFGPERGLQGIAVDPGWPARPYIYLDYTHTGNHIDVVRYTASGDLTDPFGENLTFASPLMLIDDIPDVANNHNAGGVRFGPGGRLFVSVGDDADVCGAADSTKLKGALLALDVSRLPDTSSFTVPRARLITPEHPLASPDSNAMLVWAYGMRNPWRFRFDPPTGVAYVADVGEVDFEEIDEVLPGDFLGWPWREGDLIVDRAACPEPGGVDANDYKPPIVTVPHSDTGSAISCAGMYRPVPGGFSNWPAAYYGAFYGDLFYGDYYAGYLRRLKKQSGVWITPAPVPGQPSASNWATGLSSASDFLVGPDGSLWWVKQFDDTFGPATGSIHRIRNTAAPITGVPEIASPSRPLAAAPAVFRATTALECALAEAGPVRLAIYDIAGREVRRLVDGTREAGAMRVTWDGRDGAGAAVPSGMYLARLDAGGRSERTRLIRLR